MLRVGIAGEQILPDLDADMRNAALLTGPDRVIGYILACYTGVRRNEIDSVTAHSINFDSAPPAASVSAVGTCRMGRDR